MISMRSCCRPTDGGVLETEPRAYPNAAERRLTYNNFMARLISRERTDECQRALLWRGHPGPQLGRAASFDQLVSISASIFDLDQ